MHGPGASRNEQESGQSHGRCRLTCYPKCRIPLTSAGLSGEQMLMSSLALETRKKNSISNYHDTGVVVLGDTLAAAALKKQYLASVHRPTPVCYTYNCHGLTFASRRTQITSSAEVRRILNDDDYSSVLPSDVIAGDVVIYVSEGGDIDHSGIVLDTSQALIGGGVKVLSKWGKAHEVVHMVRDCPYGDMKLEFYRVCK